MPWTTHQVDNQVPELADYNLYLTDLALQEGVRREGAGWHEAALASYGEWLGLASTQELARQANVHAPQAEPFDRWGRRVDRVLFHPAWHAFMRAGAEQGLHCSAWRSPGEGAQVARAATFILHGQIEAGTLCPLTMTSAAIVLLAREPWFDTVRPLLYSGQYDSRDIPLEHKTGMLAGMGMTEKQGGSDLRAATTRALPLGREGRGQGYRLVGHKWFFSAPTCDAHMVLAQHEGQYSCFYVPRWQPDGELNGVRLQRLKNKLGNTSNASAEVEFQDAYGVLVGEPGRGIALLVEMAAHTRLDCVLGSTALMRQALVQAAHHAAHRQAFGKALAEHALMRGVLADLALESEAATLLSLRLARAFDEDDVLSRAYRRILTPAAKFWVCKRAVALTAECMEVWGGNGYIEDGPMPRLYREAPVNAIWEGSGNVMCLDVLRGLRREPELAQALAGHLLQGCAGDSVLAAAAGGLVQMLSRPDAGQEAAGRHIAQQLVLLAQAMLLREHAPAQVADAFIQSRLARPDGSLFGLAVPPDGQSSIIRRAWFE